MNTTKATRDYIREAVKDCFENKGSWKFGTHATIIALANLVHDIDTLEARLEEYRKLLERAYKLLEIAAEFYERNDENATGEHLWLSDYAALTKGAKE